MDPRSLTLDNQTRASSPGGLPVQYPLFLRCFPRFPLVCLAVVVVSLALTPWQPSFAILAVLVLAVFALWMVRLREHFQHGCVNPAKVISHRPEMIAVITDLTTGKGRAPVIKILSHPLSRMAGGRPPVGTRLATVGLYTGNGQKGQWDDFFPVVANCASADDAAIRAMLRGIPPSDWVELEEGLRQISGKGPGLYKIDLAALEREEWAIRGTLSRLNPSDTCSVLCPADDREGILKSLREVFPTIEFDGDERSWKSAHIKGAGRDLNLAAMTRQEAAAGLEAMADYFQKLPCPFAERQDWAVTQAQAAQLVIVCNGAPRFEHREAHFHAISRIARQVNGAIVVNRAMIDGFGRVVLNGEARGPA